MRNHSSRKYNKKKVVRFRVKSQYQHDGPERLKHFQYSKPFPKKKKLV